MTQHLPARSSRRPPEPSRPGGLATVLFYAGLALVMVVLAAGTFLVVAAPVELVRDQLAAEVRARTGRTLTISGRSSLSVLPYLGLKFEDVALSAPPAMGGAPLVQMATLEVDVALWPLLSRRIEITRVVLKQPVFRLRTDSQGRRSWDFALAPADDGPVRLAQARPAGTATDLPKELHEFVRGSSENATARPPPARLIVGDILIQDGTVDYADGLAGVAEQLTGVDLKIAYQGLAAPLQATGRLLVRSEPVDVDVKIASPGLLAARELTKVDVTLKGTSAHGRFDGTWSAAGAQADGTLSIESQTGPSLARLLRQPGLGLPVVPPFRLTAALQSSAAAVVLENVRLNIDTATATGRIAIDRKPTRPLVVGQLRFTELDVGRLQAIGAVLERSPEQAGAPPASGRPAPPAGGIGDLIERSTPKGSLPTPKVQGFMKRADWSDEPLRLDALVQLDAELRLSADRVLLNQVKLGPTEAGIALKGGVLQAKFDNVRLYDGRARANITLDATGRVPVIAFDLTADGVSMQPFLRDVADNERVSGRGRLALSVKAVGATERRLMQSLDGKGELAIVDGAVAGFDAARQLLSILQGKNSGASGRTEFSELSGSVVIAAGVARNSDLKLASTAVRISGAGEIDIGQRRVDYLFRPRPEAVAVEVPIRAKGPWDDVRYNPEMNAEKAMDAIKDLGRQFKGQNLGDAIRDLTKPGEGGEPSKAQRLLDKWLKK
jgi:AsmA protein